VDREGEKGKEKGCVMAVWGMDPLQL